MLIEQAVRLHISLIMPLICCTREHNPRAVIDYDVIASSAINDGVTASSAIFPFLTGSPPYLRNASCSDIHLERPPVQINTSPSFGVLTGANNLLLDSVRNPSADTSFQFNPSLVRDRNWILFWVPRYFTSFLKGFY